MGMVRTVIRREPLANKIVKAIMYIVSGAVFATFLREPISSWLAIQGTIFDNDLSINIISIAVGFITAGLIIYALKHKQNIDVLRG